MTYSDEIKKKQFIPNVVVRMLSKYFCAFVPDSGLSPDSQYVGTIADLKLGTTTVDPRRVSNTVASFTFNLVDTNGVITALVGERAAGLINQDVEIWIGRITGSMDFSDYFKLVPTKIKNVSYDEGVYAIQTGDSTDRMNRPFFNLSNKLSGDISSGTTSIVLKYDTSDLPTAGMMKLESEFISWSGKNDGTKTLSGCIRGEKGTTAAAHDAGADVFNVVDISGNPLTLLLKLLISGGGGGGYDVLADGLGLSESLIDVAGIEALRDGLFDSKEMSFSLYNVESALQFFENEILMPCNLRFRPSADSKISVGILDKRLFDELPDLVDDDSIVGAPKWASDDTQIINSVEIEWDWDEGKGEFQQRTAYSDATSQSDYGEKQTLALQFKGIKASLDGQTFADEIGNRTIRRFKDPVVTVSTKLQANKSLLKVCDKVQLTSNFLPAKSGAPRFSSEIEVLSIGINPVNGDVTARMAFTSYSGVRGAYIAPSDAITAVTSQKIFSVATGRGSFYEAGYKLRLWNTLTNAYESDAVNEIDSISTDQITMKNNWSTTLHTDRHVIRFADYDDATAAQKRYAFVSNSGLAFGDGGETYVILF